jgi:hypothetical protein
MGLDAGQLIAISLMGVALAFGLGLFYLLVRLARWTWRWVAGARPQSQQQRARTPQQELGSDTAYAAPVSASDLYVIRSNLDAVARQVEDLERRLNLSETYGSKIVSLKRK